MARIWRCLRSVFSPSVQEGTERGSEVSYEIESSVQEAPLSRIPNHDQKWNEIASPAKGSKSEKPAKGGQTGFRKADRRGDTNHTPRLYPTSRNWERSTVGAGNLLSYTEVICV